MVGGRAGRLVTRLTVMILVVLGDNWIQTTVNEHRTINLIVANAILSGVGGTITFHPRKNI